MAEYKVYETSKILDIENKPKFEESINKVLLTEHIPDTGQNGLNSGQNIVITVPVGEVFYYPHESYLYIRGQIVKNADSSAYAAADANHETINFIDFGIFQCFQTLTYQLGTTTIEEFNNPGHLLQIKNMLMHNKNFRENADSMCWGDKVHEYIGNAAADVEKKFVFRIPLKYVFGFCQDYQKVIYGVQHRLIFK